MGEISFYFEKGNFVLKATRVARAESNGTLVFRNKMNSILFPVNFTARDYDIFFTICWYAKQMGYSDSRNFIEMPYSKIAQFFSDSLNKTRFNNEIIDFCKKVLGENGSAVYKTLEITDNDEIMTAGVFFISIKAFRNTQILRFKLNTDALDILFGTLKFMKINLHDFVSIRGKFAKTLYRLLRQYENIKPDKDGFKCVNFNRSDFERFMSVPEKYETRDLDRRVINPSIDELNENYFKKLIFEKKIAEGSKKNVIGYSFKFILKD
ncbi:MULTISPECIES: replication initiation protein [Campylobacter]|uniref:Replication initiation protein n=1 Tax=Campylobacter hyointestinalis TaxID=198 RepID=A0A562XI88_CAMHY|nr:MULTISPECIES: replication initiation protein [Campylobacter]ALV24673.1 putative replication protein [Campylobacter iguaniorum]RAZ25751.1 replication initiation protein [Campylobacter hyointestinalis subsp. lawsonii]RAZ40161.1 replication initiation protein [Campylobacter hyointestinalis subsp. lawsonii]RAZ45158.1 replication initiation protein [Campylobacter hyointestinalis subsp. lawsonii]RAZ59694.1 replication initiation protein [Campylobacter hyointestinalis subsp. lawsonii]